MSSGLTPRPARILIVDDEPHVREIVRRSMELKVSLVRPQGAYVLANAATTVISRTMLSRTLSALA